ncbi:MAG: efflux RND transporter periplasmic adaptor subunit [Thermoanaerobaculia bacterium]
MAKRISRKQFIWGGALILVVILIAIALIPERIPVDTANAEKGELLSTVEDKGETRVLDRFLITSPTAGKLRRIELRPGDPVKEGEVVTRVDPVPLDVKSRREADARVEAARQAVDEAAAVVRKASATADQAERDAKRGEKLAREGVVSSESAEQARLSLITARRDLDAATSRARASRYQLEEARAALLGTSGGQASTPIELRSPVSGRVLTIPERSARVVAAGEPIASIANPSRIELVVEVLSADAVKVDPGDEIIVEEWGGDRPLHGHVREVEPAGYTKISALGVEEQRVHVIGDLDQPAPELGDAYRIEAKIVTWRGNVLKVPVSALARAGDRWSVFVVENGRARRRLVEIGHRNQTEAEVLKGLSPGQTVIVHPSNDISDGSRVKASEI